MDNKKIALLIDAENVSSKYIKLIMDEVSSYGIATYKRVYGDFQTSSVKAWLKNLQEYAITPVFQYNYTQGKNASDSALIIDAMDILYSGHVDGFCIVTSDSDFTKLVLRLRESGMTVIGMGEQKTPTALVSACESFKFLDILFKNAQKAAQKAEEKKKKNEKKKTEKSVSKKQTVEAAGDSAIAAGAVAENEQTAEENLEIANAADVDVSEMGDVSEAEIPAEAANNIPDLDEMEKEVIAIIDAAAGDDGWVDLSELGDNLPKRVPGFDPRNYNCTKLRQFITLFDSIEVRPTVNPHNPMLSVIYIRVKGDEEEYAEQAAAMVQPEIQPQLRSEFIERPIPAIEYLSQFSDDADDEEMDIHAHFMDDYFDSFDANEVESDEKSSDGEKTAENESDAAVEPSSEELKEIFDEKNGESDIKKKRQRRYHGRSKKPSGGKAAAKTAEKIAAKSASASAMKSAPKSTSKPRSRRRRSTTKKESQ